MFSAPFAPCHAVGYNKKSDISNDQDPKSLAYTLIGLPFTSMKANGNWSLNDLTFSNLTGHNMRANQSDQIWLWVDQGDGSYDYYKFRWHPTNKWVDYDSKTTSFDDVFKDGVPAGTAFWFVTYNASSAPTMTANGQVSDVDREVTINRGEYQFVSYPFAANLKLNDSSMMDSGNCKGHNMRANQSDTIWLWVDQGDGSFDYEKWRWHPSNGWVDYDAKNTKFEDTHPNGVSIGSGFWFKSYDDGASSETYTITFKSPVK